MSIKRSRQKSTATRRYGDVGFSPGFVKSSEPEKTWEQHMEGQPDEAFAAYAITSHFAKGSLVKHPAFGKGVVLSVDGARIEVLFADAKRKLAHAP